MTKDQIDGLKIGDLVLCHVDLITYEIVNIDPGQRLGAFDLMSPDYYQRFANDSDLARDFAKLPGDRLSRQIF